MVTISLPEGVVGKPEVPADRLTDGGDPARGAGEPCSPNERGGAPNAAGKQGWSDG